MIQLAFKNIRNSFSAYRNIYSLLLLSQFIAIIILLFVYGIITSYNIKLEEKTGRYKSLYAKFEEPVSAYKIKELLPEMLSEMEDRMDFVFMDLSTGENELEVTCFSEYTNGEYFLSEDNFPLDRLVGGRYPTTIEINEGMAVAYGYGGEFGNGKPYKIGDKYDFGGKEYEIVGIIDRTDSITRVTIPINSCTEDMKVKLLSVEFDKFPTANDYELFVETMKDNFMSNVVINDFELVELDDIVRYNTVIRLAFIIGGVAAFDTIFVYSYLLEKRKKQMAIFSIEGASRIERILICSIEVLFVTAVTTLAGVVLFELVLKGLIVKACRATMEMYTLKSYLYLIISYMGIIIVGTSIMISVSTRHKVLELRKG